MDFGIIMFISCLVFLFLSLCMQLYENKLMHNVDVPIIKEYLDCNTQELKEFEEII